MTLADWLHTLSPFAIRFTDTLGIRWYGLAYAAGFVAAVWLLRWMADRGWSRLPRERVLDAFVYLVIGVLVGGRLGYVVVYERGLLTSFDAAFPWWGLLKINRGGMASHGGMIGVLVASWFVWRNLVTPAPARPPWLHVVDLMALVVPPGLFLGRLANFINGELLGKIVAKPGEPAPWWAVRFPQELLMIGDRHAAASGHAPALSDAQAQALERLVAPFSRPGNDAIEAMLRSLQGSGSGARGLASNLAPLVSARHPSQLYQALAEGPLLMAIVWIAWRRPRRPGVISAWFLIAYGVLRIATEFWRLPDAHFAVGRPLGLSRGQWLSAAMVACGVALLVWVLRAARAKHWAREGGWGGRAGEAPRAG